MNAPTTRETADHIGEANEKVTADHAELARLAEAATPGPWFASDWDAYDGENLRTIEAREPEVLSPGQSSIWPGGVRCKRIAQTEDGENPTEDAAFIAAANPATVLSLLSEIAALRGEVERVEADRIRTVDDRMTWTRRTLQAERQRDELRKALEPFAKAAEKLDGLWSEDDWRWNDSVRSGVTVRDIRRASKALANQGAD